MNSFLTSQPIDPAALAASVLDPGHGAQATFVGLVRDHHAGHPVVSLEYSAYGAMAEQVFAAIVATAEQRWAARVAAAHRLGELKVGEVAVVVVATAAHRSAAFDACRWVIDELKHRVPIWKREHYVDGSEAWVDPTAPGGIVASPP